jgi:hypothetical protein
VQLVDDSGRLLDAHFSVQRDGTGLAVIFESRGGGAASPGARNRDYSTAQAVLLRRLGSLSAVLTEAFVDSQTPETQSTPRSDRSIIDAPVVLASEPDMDALRRRMGAAQVKVGQADGTTGGNYTKRIRLVLEMPGYGPDDADALAAALAGPSPTSGHSRRRGLAQRVADLVGGNVLTITDARDSWPSFGVLRTDDGELTVALFVGRVGSSQRNRDDVERRFQNPGSNRPIIEDPPYYSLLLGLLEQDAALDIYRPLLVLADASRRVGSQTRFSIFASVTSLREASEQGWSEHRNSLGETIRCFVPELLPVAVAGLKDDSLPASQLLQAAIEDSGLMDADDDEAPPAAGRARKASNRLLRNTRFARRVTVAYSGMCAMCGLDADLVEAAHIYPVSGPGSVDEPWNGIALCPNHHEAFDRHLLAVQPVTLDIIFSPTLLAHAREFVPMQIFIQSTFERLAVPQDAENRPCAKMFADRYGFFKTMYIWMNPDT